MKKYIITFIIAMLFFMTFLNIPVSAKTYTTTITLTEQQSYRIKSISLNNKLKIRLIYKDCILYNSNITFKISNSAIAHIDKYGTVTPKRSGTTIITIKYKNRKAKIKLTIKNNNNFLRNQIVDYALSFVGKLNYVYGGNSLETGTDCSGFIHLIYQYFGIDVPRTAAAFQSMNNTTRNQLQPGDLVTYKNGGHVAIYIGNNKIVHAKGSKYGTVIDNINYGTPTGFVKIIGIK